MVQPSPSQVLKSIPGDWPGLRHRAQGPGCIHLTCPCGRGGPSREVQTPIREQEVGPQAPALLSLAFRKAPEPLCSGPIFPSASSLHSRFHHHPFLSFLWAFVPVDPSTPPRCPNCPLPPQDSSAPSVVFHGSVCVISPTLHPQGLVSWLSVDESLPSTSYWEGSGPPLVPTGRRQKGTVAYRAPTVYARAGHSRFLIAFNFSTILMTWHKWSHFADE